MTSYIWQDAWQAGQTSWRKAIEPTAMTYVTNNAISKMWRAYDWRGTVQEFNPFWLVPAEQDYGEPFWSVPTDFYGLREVYLVAIASNAIPVRYPLRVVSNLEATHVVGLPNTICYRDSAKALRIHPGAAFGASSPLYLVDGTYKTKPPKITQALQTSLMLWDDIYFEVFVQALTWAALQFSGDRKSAIEQEAIFYKELAEATYNSNLEDGEPTVHPGEPLVGGYGMNGLGYGGGFGLGGV